VTGHLRRMAAPMVLALFALMGFNLADTWFVAQLGAPQLAAMSFTFPVVLTLTAVGIGLMAGTSAVLARHIGAGDERQVKRLAWDALALSDALGLMLAVLGLATIEPLFRILGASPDILVLIERYMRIWYLNLPIILPSMAAVGAIRATGDSAGQSAILVSASLANLILDPLLIFGLAGFPYLGIEGAATASLVARILALAPGYYVFQIRHGLGDAGMPRAHELRHSATALAAVAIPAAGTNAIIPLATGVVTALIAKEGGTAVAGFGAGTRIEGMSLILFYALSAVIGPIVGQNLGAGRARRSHSAVISSVRFCLLAGAVITASLWVLAAPLAGLFSAEPAVIAIGVSYLRIMPLGFGPEGCVMVVNAAFNAAARPLLATAISLARVFVLQIPLALVGWWLGGISGIFFGLLAGNILAALLAMAMWSKTMKPDPAQMED